MANKTLDQILYELDAVSDDFGMYPKAVSGFNDERDYVQRDGFKNGWNAAVTEYGRAINKVIYGVGEPWSESEKIFATGFGTFLKLNDKWGVSLSDTWYYASADWEEIKPEDYPEVLKYYSYYGHLGALYWVYLKRGYLPDVYIPRKEVLIVKELEEFKAYHNSDKGKADRRKKYLRRRYFKKLLKFFKEVGSKVRRKFNF